MRRTIVHFTGGLAFGGLEQVLLTLLTGLDRRQWHSVLYHHSDADIAPLLEGAHAAGVETRALDRGLNQSLPSRVNRFARLLCSEKPAIFHAHLSLPEYCQVALIAAALARVPVVVATQHLFRSRPSRRFRLYQRILSTRIDRYIAVSHDIAHHLHSDLHIPAKKISVIHNGVPVGPAHPRVDVNPFGTVTKLTRQPIVFTSARLDEQKGLMHLLDAARLVPEARFIVAGDGPQRKTLEDRARCLGLNGRFLFLGHRSDVPRLLARCDVYVLPSLFEGLPLGLLEAMAAAIPVVASAVGGVGEAVVDGKTGLLVQPGKPGLLADAIRRLISNPGFAAELAIAAHARVVQEFSAESMIGQMTRAYDELCYRSGIAAQ